MHQIASFSHKFQTFLCTQYVTSYSLWQLARRIELNVELDYVGPGPWMRPTDRLNHTFIN